MIRRILIPLLLVPFLSLAQDAGIESVFDQGMGGRAAGFAGAYTGLADDSSAVYWNPAGLGYLQAADASCQFGFYPFGTLYNGVSAAYPTTSAGTFGAGFLRIGTGGITFRDNRNVVLDTGQTSGQAELVLSYGAKIPRLPFACGFSMKLNTVRIGDFSDANTTFDLGILVRGYGPEWTRFFGRYTLDNLTMGFCFKDLVSTPVRLRSFEEIEAFSFRWGTAWNGLVRGDPNHKISASFDLNATVRKQAKVALGLEYNLYRLFFVRTGYNMSSGFVLGAGIFYDFSGQRFRLDYNAVLGQSGPVHRISVLYQFGRTVDQRRNDLQKREDRALQVKIDQAVAQERLANEDRIRQIESDYSNSLRKRQEELEARRQEELDRLTLALEASNKARVSRINEENRLKLAKELSDATNALGQQNRQRIEQLKQDAEKQRLEELRQNEIKTRQELTNQRKVLLQVQQQEIDKTIKSEKVKADLEKKKAIQDEQRRSADREQKIRVEQKTIGQNLLQAKSLMFDSGDFDAAIAILQDVLRRDPGNKEAASLLEQARSAKIQPENLPADLREAINAGAQFYSQGRFDEAVKTWEKALEKYPNNWHLLSNIRKAKERLPSGQGQTR